MAVGLRTTRLTYEQIAAKLGYANRGTVHRVVLEALKTQTVEAVEQLRNLEVARLDALQVALWPAAMAGDVTAVVEVARCIMARCRLFRLVPPGTVGIEHGPRTVVVPPMH